MTMVITRRQALLNSAFAFGGTVVNPQFARAQTAASKASGQNAAIYRLSLGDFDVTVLSDGSFTSPSALLATNLTEAELKEFIKANYIGTDTFRLQINVILVNTGDRKVLIDAGAGGARQATTGRLVATLQAAGIEPTAVDIVVLTHAHPDHFWGAVDTKAGTV